MTACPDRRDVVRLRAVSDGAPGDDVPKGLSLLPRDLTPEEIASAPVHHEGDWVIEDLTDEEYQAFLGALDL
jgi:hypothetical protein